MKPLLRIRQFGIEALLRRAAYAARKKSGLLRRRLPVRSWDDVRLVDVLAPAVPAEAEAYAGWRQEHGSEFFRGEGPRAGRDRLASVLGEEGRRRLLAEADDLLAGRFLLFRHTVCDMGRPVAWLVNPRTGYRFDGRRHWSDIPDFAPEQGDIKDVWEPSRFAAAYVLTRAWAVTGREEYAEGFWSLLESWCEQNPPNAGPNWKCGQEASLRLMAWTFALHGLATSVSTTAERLVLMLKAVAATLDRVEATIGYALCQNNNHGISETMGLLVGGLLFPELRGAARRASLGRRLLEQQIARQVYADGSYIQHSFVYQRLMLHDCLWAAAVAERCGQPLSAKSLDRLRTASHFMYQASDGSGLMPNYGANDGALVLVLDGCDYRDFRPVLQLASRVLDRRSTFPPGPWDEPALWLRPGESPPPADAPALVSSAFDAGGYYTIRQGDAWALVRAHAYRDRPGHADALHVDLWWRGRNLLRDSGTWSYHGERRFEEFFPSTRAHNTIEVDGRSQMDKTSRFRWDEWVQACCTRHETAANGATVCEVEHDGYRRLADPVTHRRAIVALPVGVWVVVDDVVGSGEHDVRLHWHVGDAAAELDAAPGQLSLGDEGQNACLSIHSGPHNADIRYVKGQDDGASVLGWRSLYYGEKTPAGAVETRCRARLPLRLVSVLSLGVEPGRIDVACDLERITAECGGGRWRIDLASVGQGAVVCGVSWQES